MDEPTSSPESESTDVTPPPQPSSGCLPKAVLLLALISMFVGALVFFGVKTIKNHAESFMKSSRDRLALDAEATPSPVETPTPVAEEESLQLARALVTADLEGRKGIAAQLGDTNGSFTAAIDFLLQALPIASGEVKADIITALGLIAKKDPTAIPPLVSALEDRALRPQAIPALGALGAAAKDAVPLLKMIASGKKVSPSIRTQARQALRQIQSPAKGKKSARTAKKRKSTPPK